jgi:hypothetical protein
MMGAAGTAAHTLAKLSAATQPKACIVERFLVVVSSF